MKQPIIQLSKRDLLFVGFPSFVISFLSAELFFKFGSFSLECIAFLISWFVLWHALSWFKKFN